MFLQGPGAVLVAVPPQRSRRSTMSPSQANTRGTGVVDWLQAHPRPSFAGYARSAADAEIWLVNPGSFLTVTTLGWTQEKKMGFPEP